MSYEDQTLTCQDCGQPLYLQRGRSVVPCDEGFHQPAQALRFVPSGAPQRARWWLRPGPA